MANVYSISDIQDILFNLENVELEDWIRIIQDNDPDEICEEIEDVNVDGIDWDTFNAIITVDCGKHVFEMEIDLNEIM